jgi:aryl sulfotransferase
LQQKEEEMAGALPDVMHTYQNHILDSTRWRRYVPRDDDIVITTSYKSGTTWVQALVAYLVLGTASVPVLDQVSPWLEARFTPVDEVLRQLDAQTHRRFIKSHLPLDAMPFYRQVKYIVVARDARDVFMSLWNHHTSYEEATVAALNDIPGRVGPPLPPRQELHQFWRDWITRGWFAWESEGYPYWGNLHHTKTWWPYRRLDNILFVHFNDLLRDLPGEIRRITRFLDIECADQALADVAQAVTFATMKRNADQLLPDAATAWKGGAQTFVFQGTNGRWREILSPEELALHRQTVARVLPHDCAAWLEHGRAALIELSMV